MTRVLGISALYHDASACLLEDGRIVAAAEEERFTRVKHDARLPSSAIRYCLSQGRGGGAPPDLVVFYDKPILKFHRILETFLSIAPAGLRAYLRAVPVWLEDKLWVSSHIQATMDEICGGFDGELMFSEHHESHAASAFFPSPFEEAAVLTMDGVGEWTTTSIGLGEGDRLELLEELQFPHSLGLLYSSFTYFTGFAVNSGEYKLMGLAPYGEPTFLDTIRDELLDLKDDGSFKLNMDYFSFLNGATMTSGGFERLFGPRRQPDAPLTRRDADLARSIQALTEEVVLRTARHAHELTGKRSLCMAGGVALNCVANGRLQREGPFESLWIQPAAGDSGGSLGAALLGWHHVLGSPRPRPEGDAMGGAYLGPDFSDDEIERYLDAHEIPYRRLGPEERSSTIAGLIAEGHVVGHFQGRMEFGPRALGNRSILADARSPDAQLTVNRKIKFRESFRPFAPACLEEDVASYFECEAPSEYMLTTSYVRSELRCATADESECSIEERATIARSRIPAVTHVDGSARVQSVPPRSESALRQILEAFRDATGCSLLLNTSFNVRGEPIVCTPSDAYRCFMSTNMDHLVLEDFLLTKSEQTQSEQTQSEQGEERNPDHG